MSRSSQQIRVRIAPSPTGFAHVGTAWAALFNYAFAKKHGGKFILRIEDTDIERNIDEAEKAIYEGLHWIGLDWDEGPDKGGEFGPYKQSERIGLHQNKADELLKKGLAKKDGKALRFKNPKEDVLWKDLVRGEIKFPGDEVQDFVLLRSDGRPTYNFAVVCDDIGMQISHVIRGEEHISNTPKQIALYKAFGIEPPKFAHLPTLRNKDGKKLSKRRDPVDLGIFQKEGYLPEALLNFLCLLGWSHPEQKEIFDLEEFVKLFDLSRVRPSGPIFDTKKLDWINGQYLKKLSNEEFARSVKLFAPKNATIEKLEKVAPLVKDRIKKLSDFNNLAGFIFEKKEPRKTKSYKLNTYTSHILDATQSLSGVDDWSLSNINNALLGTIEKQGFHTGDFFMDIRGTVSGNSSTPPINESIEIIGKDETLKRLNEGLDKLGNK